MTILEYAQQYTMPKELGTQPNRRNKKVVVITQLYISPDPAGPKYKQYCQRSLVKHKSFREISELLARCETYADAYAEILQTEDVPPSKRTYSACNSINNNRTLLTMRSVVFHVCFMCCT